MAILGIGKKKPSISEDDTLFIGNSAHPQASSNAETDEERNKRFILSYKGLLEIVRKNKTNIPLRYAFGILAYYLNPEKGKREAIPIMELRNIPQCEGLEKSVNDIFKARNLGRVTINTELKTLSYDPHYVYSNEPSKR